MKKLVVTIILICFLSGCNNQSYKDYPMDELSQSIKDYLSLDINTYSGRKTEVKAYDLIKEETDNMVHYQFSIVFVPLNYTKQVTEIGFKFKSFEINRFLNVYSYYVPKYDLETQTHSDKKVKVEQPMHHDYYFALSSDETIESINDAYATECTFHIYYMKDNEKITLEQFEEALKNLKVVCKYQFGKDTVKVENLKIVDYKDVDFNNPIRKNYRSIYIEDPSIELLNLSVFSNSQELE